MRIRDFVILGILAVWLVVALVYLRRVKKQGRCAGCSAGCVDCHNCGKHI